MISFIVIGKNESFNIKRTINSINSVITKYENFEFEVIYVDSNSSDDTIAKVKEYKNVKIYRIKSNIYSAALARNIGAQNSNGDILFFMDADMELEDKIDLNYIVDLIEQESIGILSGKLPEKIYNNKNIIKEINDRYNVNQDIEILREPGGYFLIKRDLFFYLKGFKQDIKCNEEIEFFCRVRENGKKIIRTQKISCIHHNLNTLDNDAFIAIKKFKDKYYSGVWKALFSVIDQGNIKFYFEFNQMYKSWIKRICVFLMFIMLTGSILLVNLKLFTILVLINLVGSKFRLRKIINIYLVNVLTMISIIYLLKPSELKFNVIEYK